MKQKLNVIILAAGKGTRMYSAKPKVLHKLGGRPLLRYCLDTARTMEAESVHVVIGHAAEEIKQAFKEETLTWVDQRDQLGTGHAVMQALPGLDEDAVALILYGDVPLVQQETLKRLMDPVHDNSLAVLTCKVENPFGLGRIVRNAQGHVEAIVEEKDAAEEEKKIKEINTGIIAAPVRKLKRWLEQVGKNNVQGEYYLTDVVSLAEEEGCEIFTAPCEDPKEVTGINNRAQLAELERIYQLRKAKQLMLAGVTLSDPGRFDLRGEAEIAQDVEIDINVILEGKIKIARNVKIGANCVLRDCELGEGTVILPNTLIEGAVVGRNCTVGPFARIRPGTEVHEEARIGNFVETKQAIIGRGSKVNHLSYVGDTEMGAHVNVGAGTITCNYDGAAKHKTIIEDRVFIGSNSALVAPVNVGAGATIAAGSVITKDVESESLAIARTRQTTKKGWKRPGS